MPKKTWDPENTKEVREERRGRLEKISVGKVCMLYGRRTQTLRGMSYV